MIKKLSGLIMTAGFAFAQTPHSATLSDIKEAVYLLIQKQKENEERLSGSQEALRSTGTETNTTLAKQAAEIKGLQDKIKTLENKIAEIKKLAQEKDEPACVRTETEADETIRRFLNRQKMKDGNVSR